MLAISVFLHLTYGVHTAMNVIKMELYLVFALFLEYFSFKVNW